jgi:flagellar basal-body rod modification protein FlgD
MVDGVNSIGSAYYSTGGQDNSIMGKDDFLQLMLTQLKNQDPLNPMEGTEFAAQLAQFTSLEQLMNLNDAMETSINANYYLTQSINNTLSSTLIGKSVKLSGNEFKYSGQDDITLGYNLSAPASSCTVKIYNSAGQLVKTVNGAPSSSGDNKLIWDFTDNDGESVPEGEYTFEVEARDGNDELIAAEQYVLGLIEGVKFTEYGTALVVNGVDYMLSDILEIYDPSTGG